MYSLEKFHFCRLCLCGGENLMDIFEDNPKFDFVVEETIQDLLQLKVVKVHGCPWLICSTCLYKLTDFRLFKRRCVECKIAYENRFNPYNTFLDTTQETSLKVDENGILNSLVETDPVIIENGDIVGGEGLKVGVNNGMGCADILPNWDAKSSKVDCMFEEGTDLIFGTNITGEDVDSIVGTQESIEKAVSENFNACQGITSGMSLRTKVDIFTAELWKQENCGMVVQGTDGGIVSAYTEPQVPPSSRIVGVVEGSAVQTCEPNLPVQDFDEGIEKRMPPDDEDNERKPAIAPSGALAATVASIKTEAAPVVMLEEALNDPLLMEPLVLVEKCDYLLRGSSSIKLGSARVGSNSSNAAGDSAVVFQPSVPKPIFGRKRGCRRCTPNKEGGDADSDNNPETDDEPRKLAPILHSKKVETVEYWMNRKGSRRLGLRSMAAKYNCIRSTSQVHRRKNDIELGPNLLGRKKHVRNTMMKKMAIGKKKGESVSYAFKGMGIESSSRCPI